jgi:hypothetical protein
MVNMATGLARWVKALPRRQDIQENDENVGAALEDDSPSLSSLISTLVPVLVVSGILFILFLLLRRTLKRNYQPRTYLGSLRPRERTPSVPDGLFSWIGAVRKIPDSYVLNHHSLDGFLLLRYLKIAAAICFVGCIITWPVLFPINITSNGTQKELNLLSIANVTDKNRLYAHVFIAMIFYGFFFYMIARETIFYINLRQAYLLSPLYANRISSRTVLFTSVPEDYLNEAKLRRMFGKAVKNVWIANECDEIQSLVEERDKVAFKLEAAEIKLIKQAAKARAKGIKKGTATDEEAVAESNGESGSVAARWVQPKQRPTHRLKFLIGKKVDTINWCRAELERLVPRINALQAKYRAGEADFVCSVFVEFYNQNEAQAAFQSLTHHQPLHMAPRFIGVDPEQIIWENLKINWASRVVRNIITTGFVVLLIVFWSIPVGAVGAISNLKSLTGNENFKWLGFINDIPPAILGVVQGLLPAVLLAVLMALLPIVLRLMAKKAGCPTRASIELRTQSFYFLFQVIQVFLITTFSSAASAVGAKIASEPGKTPELLASNLPHASNFFLSYLIVQGLTISASAVAQLVGVIVFRILGAILDNTPRKMYKRFTTLAGLGWGTVFPIYTNLCVIALSYAVISPLVLGFASIALYLLYLAYRYNLLFVFDATIDTKGLVYPRALQQTTTGAYIGMICLIGLFGVNKAVGPLILMVAFLILVVLFHVTLNSAISPLIKYLPKSLQVEEESLMALEDGQQNVKDGPFASTGDDVTGAGKESPHATHKKPNPIVKWLKPHVYTDYHTLRRLAPRDLAEIVYDPATERNAYYHPAISSPTPLLWIPRDSMGISRQECRHSSKVIPMTDDGASLNEKNKIVWDQESGRPPVYQEKVYY